MYEEIVMTFKKLRKINLICISLLYSFLKITKFRKVPSIDNSKEGYLGNASFVDYNKDSFLDIFL
jgi:hypothetical protein